MQIPQSARAGIAESGSGVAGLTPGMPVVGDGLGHVFGGREQPLRFQRIEVPANLLHRVPAAKMDICRFPPHGKKQPEFVAVRRQNAQFNAAAVRGQTAYDPVTMQPHEGIGIPYRAIDNRLVHDLCWTLFSPSPVNRRGNQGFGFPCNSAAVAFPYGDQARVPQAP